MTGCIQSSFRMQMSIKGGEGCAKCEGCEECARVREVQEV